MNFKRQLILASSSPRRQHLMQAAGFAFRIEKPDVEEDFPSTLPVNQVAKYLACKKAEYFRPALLEEIVVTADTVVILNSTILNKPAHRDEAIHMLQSLSGKTHTVMTGVCILSKEWETSFDESTDVKFKDLSLQEIEFYIDHYAPYDKAGSYGAQDWFGMVAIEKIEGSYFNVMGLPIHRVYQILHDQFNTL